MEDRIRFFKRKFASIAMINRYRNLYREVIRKSQQKKHNTYFHSTSTSSQFFGRLTPGIGQAGQLSARSPAPVKQSPPSMFPRPARFINLRWRNIRTIRIRDLYRVLMEKIQLSEMTEGETYLRNIQLHIVHHIFQSFIELVRREFSCQSDCVEDLQHTECGARLGLVNCRGKPFTP